MYIFPSMKNRRNAERERKRTVDVIQPSASYKKGTYLPPPDEKISASSCTSFSLFSPLLGRGGPTLLHAGIP